MTRPLRCLAALAALVLLPAASRGAPCPGSSFTVSGATFTNTAAVYDTVAFQGEAHWDMTLGRVYMQQYGSLGGATVDAFDDFEVTGVAPGTPVTVYAILEVDGAVWTPGCGSSGCAGMYEVTFRHGNDSLKVNRFASMYSGRVEYHDAMQLNIPFIAGQPERIEIRAYGRRSPGGSHWSEADCRLRFTLVDEGVGITSCKGFAGTLVPTRTTTWGRLKTIYR